MHGLHYRHTHDLVDLIINVCVCVCACVQLTEPELVAADVRAVLQSEYNTAYNTKNETTGINQTVVNVAAGMEHRGRSLARNKTTVLSKMLNAINKTIAYPLVMSSAYLLGYGDAWCPTRFARHDFALFQRECLGLADPYADGTVDHVLVADSDGDGQLSASEAEDSASVDSGDDGDSNYGDAQFAAAPPQRIAAIDAGMMYHHRSDALSDWSPFEVTMAFTCDKPSTADAKLFPLKRNIGRGGVLLAHKPRVDKSKRPAVAIPQPTREHPRRPADDASSDVKQQYAAWALGNFFSDRRMAMLRPGDDDDATTRGKSDLWSMFRRWERRLPRGEKDEFALQCINNVELRLKARALMRDDCKHARLLRRQLLDTVAPDTATYSPGDVDNQGDSPTYEVCERGFGQLCTCMMIWYAICAQL